jgi:4,5-DOPA dioxygenase extradiol
MASEFNRSSAIANSHNTPMPVIFAAHGAPILLDDAAWMSELATWAESMPKPKGILMISAHGRSA